MIVRSTIFRAAGRVLLRALWIVVCACLSIIGGVGVGLLFIYYVIAPQGLIVAPWVQLLAAAPAVTFLLVAFIAGVREEAQRIGGRS